ncbi:MAG: tetratricopeptide repeat protein [Betaproteobacteria bacterium]|nr:tetratricopeptide repeat protein [Betaproteobacteria bacterium]
MNSYGVAEVEKLLGLPRATVRALVQAGFVAPTRGPRNAWRFSFQDLIVLRTAQALSAANVPAKRIARSIRELRRQLPEAMPLSGIRIAAVADRVVVREGAATWQADTGQYLLAFEGDPANGSLAVMERKPAEPRVGADEWFDRGASIEEQDVQAAEHCYREAIRADGSHADAYLNLGSLLHDAGRLAEAERTYREGMKACRDAALLHYNLAVLLEDLGRKEEALEIYRGALRRDARLADCHYNLALLCDQLGRGREAIRHMAQYRRLTSGK